MTPLLTKALIGTGVVGVTAAGAGTIYWMSNSSEKESNNNKQETPTKVSISSLLIGKRLLKKETGDDSKWTTSWENFKKSYTDTKVPTSPWSFTNWSTDKSTSTGLNSFKDQCVALGATEVENNNDPIFKAVDANCTTAI